MHSEVSRPAPSHGWHGAALNVATRLGGAVLAFGLTIALARTLPAAEFGRVNLVLAWLAVAIVAGGAGMPLSVVRLVAESAARGRDDLARGAMLFALGGALAVSALVALAVRVLLHSGLVALGPGSLAAANAGIALLVPSVLLSVSTAVLQAMHHAVAAEVLNSIVRPVLMVAALALLLHAADGEALGAPEVLWLYFWISLAVLAGLVALALHWQAAPGGSWRPAFALREWAGAGPPMLAALIAFAVWDRMDMLLLGWTGSPADTAVYSVSLRFYQTLQLAMNALAAVVAPRFVACLPALAAGDARPAQRVLHDAARWALFGCGAAWLCFLALEPLLATLFGERYSASHLPLMILATGQLLAALCGPALIAATMAGKVRVALSCLFVGMLANGLINVLAVPVWGATGAALGAAAGTLVASALARPLLRRDLGVDTAPLATLALLAPLARRAS